MVRPLALDPSSPPAFALAPLTSGSARPQSTVSKSAKEARLREFVEITGATCVDRPLVLSLPSWARANPLNSPQDGRRDEVPQGCVLAAGQRDGRLLQQSSSRSSHLGQHSSQQCHARTQPRGGLDGVPRCVSPGSALARAS